MNDHNRAKYIDPKRAGVSPPMIALPLQKIIEREISRFILHQGRRPRVLISQPVQKNQGQRINEVRPREAATRFAQYGFDVDISPEHMTPGQLAKMAVENDVHLVCLLSDRESAREFLDSLSDALNNFSCDEVGVIFCHCNPTGNHGEDQTAEMAGPLTINPGDADDILRLLKELTMSLY